MTSRAEVGVQVLARCHDVDQGLRVEHVVAHARQAALLVARHRRRRLRLLVESDDLAVGARLDHPEVDGFLLGDGDRRDRHPGTALDVMLDHLARIHAVDVVGAEDTDEIRALVVEQVQVLVDRVGRALEPLRAASHLGRDRRHVVVEKGREPPRLGDVTVEAVALVLREHDDLQVAGVGEVRQREVDQTVRTPERHGRLGAVVREREQPLAFPTGEDDDENLRLSHAPRVLSPAPSTVRTGRGIRLPVDSTTNRQPSRGAAR